jgi:hypothetical protein
LFAKDAITSRIGSKALTDHCCQRNDCDELYKSFHGDIVSFHFLKLPPVNIEQFSIAAGEFKI